MSIRSQIRPVLVLALPLILAEVGWMVMGIVDTIMVGHMANPALAISAAAPDLQTALDKAYAELAKISFEGMQFRRDIGHRALSK